MAVNPDDGSVPSWVAERAVAWERLTASGVAVDEFDGGASDSVVGGGGVYSYGGMNPVSAARIVERVQDRRLMVDEFLSSGTVVQPVAMVVPPRPAPPESDDAQMAGYGTKGPGDSRNIDPGIVAPPTDEQYGAPGDIAPSRPSVPMEAGPDLDYLLYQEQQDPGGGASGGGPQAAPGPGGGNGAGGSGQGGPPPSDRWIENPPGHDVEWDGDHPRWEDGKDVYIWVDPDGRWHYYYPVPVPGTADDAPGDLQHANPQPQQATPGDRVDGSEGGQSAPPVDADLLPVAPSDPGTAPAAPEQPVPDEFGPPQDSAPHTLPEPRPQEADQPPPVEADRPPANAESKESGVGEPSFVESLIPVYGSAKAAIHNFQNGQWGWGIVNSLLAVSDLFLVKSIFTVGGKVILKLAEMVVKDPAAIGKAIVDLADSVGGAVGKAAEGVGKAVDGAVAKGKEILGGLFGKGKRKPPEAPKLQDPAFDHGSLGRDFKSGVHDPKSEFLPKERDIADRLEAEGWRIDQRPVKPDVKNPDAMIRKGPDDPGMIVDFKTLDSGSNNALKKNMTDTDQLGPNDGLVVDGRKVGTTREEAQRAYARAKGQPGGRLPSTLHVILGDGSIITFGK